MTDSGLMQPGPPRVAGIFLTEAESRVIERLEGRDIRNALH